MIHKSLFLAGLTVFLLGSCDVTHNPGHDGEKHTTLSIKLEETGASYTFSVETFMRENYEVFQDNTVNELTKGIWDNALLRWGFRKKPVGGVTEEIFWIQKSEVDRNDADSYEIIVPESLKSLFKPQKDDFPVELSLVADLEVYLELQVDEFIISTQLDLPADFKIKLGISMNPPAGNLAPSVIWDDANTNARAREDNYRYFVDTPADKAAANYIEGTVNGGELYRFSVIAHDPEGDALSYSWYLNGKILAGEAGSRISLPIVSPTVGKTVAEVGAMSQMDRAWMEVKVSVRDFTSRQPVEISKQVELNRNPSIIAVQNKDSISTGEHVTIKATATDTDDMSDWLTVEWQYRKQGDVSWIDWPPIQNQETINMYTRISSVQWPQGLPSNLDSGTYEIKAKVDDFRGGIGETILYIRYM